MNCRKQTDRKCIRVGIITKQMTYTKLFPYNWKWTTFKQWKIQSFNFILLFYVKLYQSEWILEA